MGRTLSSLKSDEAMLTSDLEEKQSTLTQLGQDIEELKAKKERVTKQVGSGKYTTIMPYVVLRYDILHQTVRLVKDLKAKQKVSGHSPGDVERDIELREMRDFGNSLIQQLGSKAAKQPEMMSTLQLLFSQAGLPPPPSPTASRTGSALSSARSSISQLSALSSARYVYIYKSSCRQCTYCYALHVPSTVSQELRLPYLSHTHHPKSH